MADEGDGGYPAEIMFRSVNQAILDNAIEMFGFVTKVFAGKEYPPEIKQEAQSILNKIVVDTEKNAKAISALTKKREE